jgi:hypothetical protein
MSLLNTEKLATSRIGYANLMAGLAARKRRKNRFCVNSTITMVE